MPSGFTSDLYEGKDVSFEQFALQCARGMGALIMMRDDPWDAPIPTEFTVSPYYEDALADAELDLTTAEKRTLEDWAALAESARIGANTAWEIAERRNQDLRDRYGRMLAQVNDWTPPTAEHEGLKNLMVEQLTESIRFDTSSYRRPAEVHRTAEEYRRDEMVKLRAQKKRAEESLREERERAASRTAWVRELRASLTSDTGVTS